MEDLKEKVFDELRDKKLGAGHIWKFQIWNIFRNELNPKELKLFDKVIMNMVNDGFFEIVGSYKIETGTKPFDLKLTQKCEDILYQKM